MSRKTEFARCVFVPRYHVENLPAGSVVFDVSSYADPLYCELSPMWVHGGIPVRGMSGETSHTVEGVWQGLKVIRGKIATRFFRGPGAKRGGKPSGHQFGKKELGIIEARRLIYVPAYGNSSLAGVTPANPAAGRIPLPMAQEPIPLPTKTV
ncbi:MAG: hypothetical protein L0241_21235, partial [Planctomycetia bacterium]|nr:hypothetical protein [Planctomycetia bacterium]